MGSAAGSEARGKRALRTDRCGGEAGTAPLRRGPWPQCAPCATPGFEGFYRRLRAARGRSDELAIRRRARRSPGAARSTGFGATLFDLAAELPAARRSGPESAFDVCHVGVVLRALMFVHGVMAIGMVFAAASFSHWLALTAAGSSVALPAVLVLAVVVCALQAAARPRAARRAVGALVGARRALPRSPGRASSARCCPTRPRPASARWPASGRRSPALRWRPRSSSGCGCAPRRRCRRRRRRGSPSCSRASARTSCSTRSTPR